VDERISEFLGGRHAMMVHGERSVSGSVLYAAWIFELPGCVGQGSSPHEAVERLMDLLPVYLGSILRRGEELPGDGGGPEMTVARISFYDAASGSSTLLEASIGSGSDPKELESLSGRRDETMTSTVPAAVEVA
jgi:predicted RNase H-like HicB family nuclease